MNVTIRAATVADVVRVIELYGEFTQYIRSLHGGGDAKGNLTTEIYLQDGFGENPGFFGLVAESNHEIIGYLLYHFGYDSEEAVRLMHIMDLYVAQQHRKLKAGVSLMRHAQIVCSDVGAKEILWSVYKPNQPARNFYLSLGAKIIDDEDYMYLEI